jgi:hypothetical protein
VIAASSRWTAVNTRAFYEKAGFRYIGQELHRAIDRHGPSQTSVHIPAVLLKIGFSRGGTAASPVLLWQSGNTSSTLREHHHARNSDHRCRSFCYRCAAGRGWG